MESEAFDRSWSEISEAQPLTLASLYTALGMCGRCGSHEDVTTCICREHTKEFKKLCYTCRVELHPDSMKEALEVERFRDGG